MKISKRANAPTAAGLLTVAFATLFLGTGPVRAQSTGAELSMDCTTITETEAEKLLGIEVQPPDDVSRAGGICSFASTSVSDDGVLSYAIVTQSDVQARAPYFRLLQRKCAGVQPGAPNFSQCATFGALSEAHDIYAYFAARTSSPEAHALTGLGDAAASTPVALYVRRGGEVFESVVRNGEFLDVDRSTTLAKLLLARVAPIAAPPPAPAASNAP